ncbi:MAG: diguanylate cyclase [Gammaproteobacteria bacterium]|nr:diguanylate cyclase [Gammaproteobacteria bacterium]
MSISTALRVTLFFCALFSIKLAALDPEKRFQNYVVDKWSIEQGLPQITVSSILQDNDGYIWVATQAGLARFDGVQFKTYSTDNTPGIRGNFIQDLHVDQSGRLWIATYKGLTVRHKHQFTAVPTALDQQPSELNIQAIAETTQGQIWVSANEGVFYFEQGQLKPFTLIKQASQDILAHGDTLYISVVGRLLKVNGQQVEELLFPADYQQATVNQSIVYKGKLWLATNKGLLFLTPNGQLQEFQTDSELFRYPVDALGKDSDDNLWVGTIKGLFRIHGDRVTDHVKNDNKHDFKQVHTIYEDHEKNLWLGSYIDGIARVWSGRTYRFSRDAGLTDTLVWSVTPTVSGDAIWTGTNSGLAKLENNQFRTILEASQLPHPTVYTMLAEADGLWIGTRKGLTRLVAGEVVPPKFHEHFSSLQINSIFRDSRNRLWMATSDGLFEYTEQAIKRYSTPEKFSFLMRPIREMRNGEIWVGTQKGLYRVEGDMLQPVGLNQGLNQSLDVTAILEFGDDNIAIATLSQGLFIFHQNYWHHITENDGLPANESFTLLRDNHDHLWVSGFKGLYQVPLPFIIDYIERRTNQLGAYMLLSESGGIIGSQKSFCCNGAGNAKGFFQGHTLWYPSRDGVVKLDTDNITLNKIAPNVLIERFYFANQWHYIDDEKFSLSEDQRDIAIDFTALSFRDPKSVQFEYRLLGYQEQWRLHDSKAQRRVNYTNLPPGQYTFAVRASNNAGKWSNQAAEFQFSIAPYYYETIWFYLICIVAAIIAVYFWHRLRLRSLQEKKLELEQKIKEHTAQLEVSNQKLHEAVAALKEASHTDQLSGLKNRRYLNSQLPSDLAHFEREFERLRTTGPMIFMLADIDHFKNINDKFGHNAGDAIIKMFSDIIKSNIREGDYAVRWGGEEFLVVFRPMDATKSVEIIERLRNKIDTTEFVIDEQTSLHVTCSIGISEYPFFANKPHALTWEQTVELADHALYYVKQHGRNGWACFHPTDTTAIDSTIVSQIKTNLDELIDNDKIAIASSID